MEVEETAGSTLAPAEPANAERSIANGDALRDRQLWREAALAYREALDVDAERAGIWVQYGHMLKESGDFAPAEAAYRVALELDPGSADTQLQLGHLFKLRGDREAAADAYRKALEIDPSFDHAVRELNALGGTAAARLQAVQSMVTAEARKRARRPAIYFDVTDILWHFNAARAPTGIQRVVTQIVSAAMALEATDADIQLCAVEPVSLEWKPIAGALLTAAIAASGAAADAEDRQWLGLNEALGEALRHAPAIGFARRCVLVALGSPWGIPNYLLAVRQAKRRHGVRYIGFVHDAVPLLLPRFCAGQTAIDYSQWLSGLSVYADAMLTNAENTRRDFEQIWSEVSSRRVSCTVVRLSGQSFPAEDDDAAKPSDAFVARFAGRRFVLFVGTLEPRKNHLFVLRAWTKLLREASGDAVPELVLVGRLGWDYETVLDYLGRTPLLRGRVRLLQATSDVELAYLYEHCDFTIYNSEYEGWGLPVTESLSFGKVPLIPRHSSLVEAGGDGAAFFAPGSEADFLEQATALIARPPRLDVAAAGLRTWSEIAAEVVSAALALLVDGAPSVLAAGTVLPELTLGTIYRPIRLDGPGVSAAFAVAEAFRSGASWQRLATDAAWTDGATFGATLLLPDEARHAGDRLFLYLSILAPEARASLTVEAGSTPAWKCEVCEYATLKIEVAPADAEIGFFDLVVRQEIEPIEEEEEEFFEEDPSDETEETASTLIDGVGIAAFMCCRESDASARLSFLELSDLRILERPGQR